MRDYGAEMHLRRKFGQMHIGRCMRAATCLAREQPAAGGSAPLVSSGSSAPLSVRLQLAGDAGLSYDQKFILTDTGEPPGEEKSVRDYNSGMVEVVLPDEQMVNATAAVYGGGDLPVFVVLAKCR